MALTVLGSTFSDWVKKQIEIRNEKVLIERNNAIEMDPQMAQAFHQSTAVSSKLLLIALNQSYQSSFFFSAQKGIGANMLKVGVKRRRTKTQIDQDKEEAELRERAVNASLLENEQLKQQVEQMKQNVHSNSEATQILSDLMAQGLVQQDEQNNIVVPSASKQRPHGS